MFVDNSIKIEGLLPTAEVLSNRVTRQTLLGALMKKRNALRIYCYNLCMK